MPDCLLKDWNVLPGQHGINKTLKKEFLSGFGFRINRDYIRACYSFGIMAQSRKSVDFLLNLLYNNILQSALTD
jgi:hypothetical protein